MTQYGLTKRQSDALEFITAGIKGGLPPTFDEIKDHLGLKSKSGVHRIITALVDRGHIIRLPNSARCLAFPNDDDVSNSKRIFLEIMEVCKQAKKYSINRTEAFKRIDAMARQGFKSG